MKAFVTILLCSLSFFASADNYYKDIDQFFESYTGGDIVKAVDNLYASNKYVSSAKDQITNIKNQLNSLPGLVGEIHFVTKLDEYMVGDLFTTVTYLVTYDRQPLRFEFQYFRTKQGWRIFSMSFDDDLDEDIERLARDRALARG